VRGRGLSKHTDVDAKTWWRKPITLISVISLVAGLVVAGAVTASAASESGWTRWHPGSYSYPVSSSITIDGSTYSFGPSESSSQYVRATTGRTITLSATKYGVGGHNVEESGQGGSYNSSCTSYSWRRTITTVGPEPVYGQATGYAFTIGYGSWGYSSSATTTGYVFDITGGGQVAYSPPVAMYFSGTAGSRTAYTSSGRASVSYTGMECDNGLTYYSMSPYDIAVPSGYQLVSRSGNNFYIRKQSDVRVHLTNGTPGTNYGKGIQGAKFTASSSGGSASGSTNANGDLTLTVPAAAGSSVTITQTSEAPTYVDSRLSESDPKPSFTVTSANFGTTSPTATWNALNYEQGKISMHKLDSETGEDLAGATFTVTKQGGTASLYTGSTDTNGNLTSTYLGDRTRVGDFVDVTETYAPEGFETIGKFALQITRDGLGAGKAQPSDPRVHVDSIIDVYDTVTRDNVPGTTVKVDVTKVKDGHTEPLSHGEVDTTTFSGGTYTSGSTGRVSIDGTASTPELVYGDKNTVTIVTVPSGYVQPATPVSATATLGIDGDIMLGISPQRTITASVTDSLTADPVAGAEVTACYTPASGRSLTIAELAQVLPCPFDGAEYRIGAITSGENGIAGPTSPMRFVQIGDVITVRQTGTAIGHELDLVDKVFTVTPEGITGDSNCTSAGIAITCSFKSQTTPDLTVHKTIEQPQAAGADQVTPDGAMFHVVNLDRRDVEFDTAGTNIDGVETIAIPGSYVGDRIMITETQAPYGGAIDFNPINAKVIVHDNKPVVSVNGADPFVAQHDKLLTIPTSAKTAQGKYVPINGGSVTDTVTYSGLIPGREYQIAGTLMTPKALGDFADAKAVVTGNDPTFIPDSTGAGTVEVTFDVPAALRGSVLVAYERLFFADDSAKTRPLVTHESMIDLQQSAYFATMTGTVVNNDPAMGNIIMPGDDVIVTATICAAQPDVPLKIVVDAIATGPDGVNYPVTVTGSEDYTPADTECHPVEVKTHVGDDLLPGTTLVFEEDLFQVPAGGEENWTPGSGDIPVATTANGGNGHGTGDDGSTTDPGDWTGGATTPPGEVTDKNQTSYYPLLSATRTQGHLATDPQSPDDGTQNVAEINDLVDTVSYVALQPNRTYELTADLYLFDGNGNRSSDSSATAKATFIPDGVNGSTRVIFPKSELDEIRKTGEYGVVYESLHLSSDDQTLKDAETGAPQDYVSTSTRELSFHRDAADEDQWAWIPAIDTSASNAIEDFAKTANPGGTVVDTVTFSGLKPGVEYTLKGSFQTLNDNSDQPGLLGPSGVEGETTFTPQSESGSVDVLLTIPDFGTPELAALLGRGIVAYEYLYEGDLLLVSHTDVSSEAQTVYVPNMETDTRNDNVLDQDGNMSKIVSNPEIAESMLTRPGANIVDVITYQMLTPGTEYVIAGELNMLGEDGTAAPTGIKASQTFTAAPAESGKPYSNGQVEVEFKLTSEQWNVISGKQLVAFEVISQKVTIDVGDSNHNDLENPSDIGATDQNGGKTDVGQPGPDPDPSGATEQSSQEADSGETGVADPEAAAQDNNGSEGAGAAEEAQSQTVTGDGSNTPQTVSVYRIIAIHIDPADERQMAYAPSIVTSASNLNAELQSVVVRGGSVLDTVSYAGVQPNVMYVAEGEIFAVGDDGNLIDTAITGSTQFVPESVAGSIDVHFDVPNELDETIVGLRWIVHETVRAAGATTIAEHKDNWDFEQSVWMPAITTRAFNQDLDFEKVVGPGHVLSDEISYRGFQPDVTYTVTGSVQAIGDDGELIPTGIENQKTFTPPDLNGKTVIDFAIPENLDPQLTGRKWVVFETVTLAGYTIAAHENQQDEEQQVWAPSIATDANNQYEALSKLVRPGDTLVDTVTYAGLQPGLEYSVSGEFMAPGDGCAPGAVVDADGSDSSTDEADSGNCEFTETGITGISTFVADDTNGTAQVAFSVPDALDENLVGTYWVAFETLSISDRQVAGTSPTVPESGATASGESQGSGGAGSALGEGPAIAGINPKPLAEHKDPRDGNQTVWSPFIETKAVNSNETLAKLTRPGDTLTDTVTYAGLQPGVEYTISGEFQTLDESGAATPNGVTGTTTFTPDQSYGQEQVTFTVPENLADENLGVKWVAFETVSVGDATVIEHKDPGDEKQIVFSPRIETEAVNAANTLNKLVRPGDTLVDTVTYAGVQPDQEYQISGEFQLVDESGATTGTGVTGTATFTASETNGTQQVSFAVPDTLGPDISGRKWVAFETVTIGGVVLVEHNDPTDEKQTVYVPSITTHAANADPSLKKIVRPGDDIIDTITYAGLQPGVSYTVSGDLIAAEGSSGQGDSVGAPGSVTFTPDTTDGSVDVTLHVPSNVNQWYLGSRWVAFESVSVGSQIVVEHKDLNDPDQSVFSPGIKTFASNADLSLSKTAVAGGSVTDTVTYTGLQSGETYTASGTIMVVDGSSVRPTGITGTATFVASSSSGTVDVPFQVGSDISKYAGHRWVVFETVTMGKAEVAKHQDPSDTDQTLWAPAISTELLGESGGGSADLSAGGATLTDVITYAGLEPGRTYAVRGSLMSKESGTDTGVVSSSTFTPSQPSGSTEVSFQVPQSLFDSGSHVVVAFEEVAMVSNDRIAVASHKDINSTPQSLQLNFGQGDSITIEQPPTDEVAPPVAKAPDFGGSEGSGAANSGAVGHDTAAIDNPTEAQESDTTMKILIWVSSAMMLLLALLLLVFLFKRRKREEEDADAIPSQVLGGPSVPDLP